ncbi:endonuclease/exonuclease/phosphatase family protein [uncultured Dysgonomonas sp.]|uniref:Endonuclease/exonuclease/phosphatase domain-containing protein n=1 Tax=uncultured Dysgonomonas sp. TaxID=206096 RepID=A0A212JW49_9BACT|nr:endonuclease/exonuclease/phosphatase family protein [uncultured Dysgonomonas sp.]SBW03617.1 conserved hypothetical protein [uncultured Dysgonomonas sp.]
MDIIIKTLLVCFILMNGYINNVNAQKQTQIKVMSYNLRFGELASLEELAEFIKKENPDIVALQEVDVKTYRERAQHQNGKNFISELAFRTGMLSLYGKTIPYMGGYYGIGILTKYPYISAKRILLPMPEGSKEQRAYLVSDIELPDGNIFTFVSTHLDYPTSEVRLAQVDSLNSDLLKHKNPIVLCGDFNAKPDSYEISVCMSEWKQVSNMNFTSPAKNAKSKIDYIFCYPHSKWQIISAETPVIQLSDHLPVIATLELLENQD